MSSDYNEGKLVASLRANFWSPDEAGEEIFQNFKETFVRKNAQQRRADLMQLEGYFEEHPTPSRELADLITKRRELNDLHMALYRSGR
jgi:hypothetical protein